MRNKCDERFPSPKEVEYLTPFGNGRFTELQAIVTIGYYDEVEPWQIGRACWLAWGEKKGSGFSPGTTTDEEQRRSNWSSCASKARRKWNLNSLTDQLKRFREDGGKPQSVSWKQMIARCDHLIIHGSAGESLRAIELKTKLTGKGDSITPRQFLEQWVARLGPERTKRGLEEFGAGHLINAAPELFTDEEDNNGESRSYARRAGDDIGNLDGGGIRRVSDDTAREVDQGPGNAGGSDAGQRHGGSREINERL